MPTVPRYDQQQVKPQALQGGGFKEIPDRLLDTDQGGVPQAAQGLAGVAEKLLLEEKRKADDMVVTELDGLAAQKQSEIQSRVEKDFRRSKAPAAQDFAEQAWGDTAKEIASRAKNDEQRLAIEKSLLQRGGAIFRTTEAHVGREMMAHDTEVTNTAVAAEYNNAIQNYTSTQAVADAIERSRQKIAGYADRSGQDADWVAAHQLEATSKIHRGVIERHLGNGNDLRAGAYFGAPGVKDAMTGEDLKAVEHLLDAGSTLGRAQRLADGILGQQVQVSGEDGSFGRSLTMTEALERAREIDNPKVREAVRDQIKAYYADQEAVRKTEENRLYETVANQVDRARAAGGNAPLRGGVVPLPLWERLTPASRKALESRYEDRPLDPKAYLDFVELSPKELASLTRQELESRFFPRFDPATRKSAALKWEAAREAASGNTDKISSLVSFDKQVDQYLRQQNMIPQNTPRTKLSKKDADLYTDFMVEGQRRVEEFEKSELAGKRKATPSERQKVLEGLRMEQVYRPGGWFSSNKPRLAPQLQENERGDVFVPLEQIPKAKVDEMNRLLGGRASRSKLERMYGAYLAGDRARFQKLMQE